jgi:hypothetical protein
VKFNIGAVLIAIVLITSSFEAKATPIVSESRSKGDWTEYSFGPEGGPTWYVDRVRVYTNNEG